MKKLICMLVLVCAVLFLTACAEDAMQEDPEMNDDTQYELEIQYVREGFVAPATGVLADNSKYEITYFNRGISRWDSMERLLSTDFTTDIVRLEILSEPWSKNVNIIEPDDPISPLYIASMIWDAKVLEVFQGDLQPGDIIQIRQDGKTIDGYRNLQEGTIYFNPGDDVIVFLDFSLNGIIPFMPVHPHQTIFHPPLASHNRRFVTNESIMSMDAELSDVVLEPVSSLDALTLTIGDLQRIAEENNLR